MQCAALRFTLEFGVRETLRDMVFSHIAPIQRMEAIVLFSTLIGVRAGPFR